MKSEARNSKFETITNFQNTNDLTVAKTAMGKPPSKASEGGDVDVLGESEDVTKGEVLLVSEEHVLIVLKVRLCRRFRRRDYA